MRLNSHEEEVLGQGSPSSHHKPHSNEGRPGHDHPKMIAGCPRFGHHAADRHRESEIVGGAFET